LLLPPLSETTVVPPKDEVILVRQYRHAIGRWVWELPAGSLKPAEDVSAAAQRECHEETGLVPSGAVLRR